MIVNLNLHGKNVVVVGGGREALKRIDSLLGEQCKITLISDAVDSRIAALAKKKKIRLEKQKIQDLKFFAAYRPDLVITATDDYTLNQRILSHAKKKKIMAYSSDDPESSDFANLATVNVEGTVRIAVFTGGKSPTMAKMLKAKIGKNIKTLVSREDIDRIKIQEAVRTLAKKKISSPKDRKAFLADLLNDKKIKQLIKDGMLKEAEKRSVTMLRDL